MSKIKKFSNIVSAKIISESTETEKGQAAVEALIKKMGYNSIEELKREKTLISKLENLMKEFSPKNDISEDEAEDIEDEVVKRGEPKSLEGDAGKKEEGGEVGTEDDEITEDEAEDIEAEVVKRGEPKELDNEDDEDEDDDNDDDIEEDKAEDIEAEVIKRGKPKSLVEDEAEDIEDEVLKRGEPKDKSAELEDELEDKVTVKGKEVKKKDGAVLKTSKRILSFDEFIAEETVNKNVSYQDDEEETEDNAVPVAASYQHKGGKSVNEKKEVAGKDAGNLIKGAGTGKKLMIDDITYICLGGGKWKNENSGEKLNWIQLSAMASALGNKEVIFEGEVNEAEIKSDEEFKEYAVTVLKKAFGDKFDQAKADEVADGLISKHSGDYGAMVGALQASLG